MPKFWSSKNFISYLFLPLSLLWFLGSKIKLKPAYKSSKKIICIGNILAGGTGKTPLTIYIASILQKQNKKVIILTKGYKGTLANTFLVSSKNSAFEVGDEALLLHKRDLKVVKTNSRKLGVKFIEDNFKDVDIIITDDGFQDTSIYKDFSILVFSGQFNLKNTFLIPAGSFREGLKSGIKKANCVFITQKDKYRLKEKLNKIASITIFNANYTPEEGINTKLKYLAFAGIGLPAKFFTSLSENGIEVLIEKEYGDHYSYSNSDFENLIKEAKKNNLTLITTEKDFVKIPLEYQKEVVCFKINLALNKIEEEVLIKDLKNKKII